jgi:hypothetical protein
MNLAQIKTKLGIPQFELNTATNEAGEKTEWMRHWDNENRVAVSIHKDTVAELKTNSKINSLGLQHETRTGEKGEYSSYRIVKYTESEETL